MLAVKNELSEGCTTVGGHIESSHLKPSKIGDVVKATAEVTKVDGKKIEFKVSAYSGERLRVGDGTSGMTLLGEGTHLRFIVDREKFLRPFKLLDINFLITVQRSAFFTAFQKDFA